MMKSSSHVTRKRLWDDFSELNAAVDKIGKPSKNPKIQSLTDEIINDGSTEGHPPFVPQK